MGGGGNEHSESSSHANNDKDTPRGYRDFFEGRGPRDQGIRNAQLGTESHELDGIGGGDGNGQPVTALVCVSPCHPHRQRAIVDKCWKNKFLYLFSRCFSSVFAVAFILLFYFSQRCKICHRVCTT